MTKYLRYNLRTGQPLHPLRLITKEKYDSLSFEEQEKYIICPKEWEIIKPKHDD
jgi:hypothetical protein